jgi:hypothetical protein
MNKHMPLLEAEMEDGCFVKILKRYEENASLLPIGMLEIRTYGLGHLDYWWKERRIPLGRADMGNFIYKIANPLLQEITLNKMLEKSLGLNLSDQYWIRNQDNISWNDVNHFENIFSEDVGNLLMYRIWRGGSMRSPDLATDGAMKKRWTIVDGSRCLMKASRSLVFNEQKEPFREVFGSMVAKILTRGTFVNVVDYTLIEGRFYDTPLFLAHCRTFVTRGTEYVPMKHFRHRFSRLDGAALYHYLADTFACLGLKLYLDAMILLDYIIANEDRHFGNFGLIRNAETGEFVKPAPIFDNGESMFVGAGIDPGKIKSKPFISDFDEQIKLADRRPFIKNIQALSGVIGDIFDLCFRKDVEGSDRYGQMRRFVMERVQSLLN